MESITFVGGKKKVKINDDSLSLRDFYNKRNKVLIIRDTGGLGDILMMRMIFQDFKKVMPQAYISFAIPINYHKVAFNHPYIDEVLNSKEIDENKFGISYNLTTACVRYEMKIRPRADRHRAEIWTTYCGLKLSDAEMYLSNETKSLDFPRKKGYVCVAPISNMVSKDLDELQIQGIIEGLKSMDYSPYIIHHKPIPYASCPVINKPLEDWIAYINTADYVISVDTATFHAANGLNKPTVVIFSWADHKAYTKFHKKCIAIQRHRDYTPDWTCGPCYNHEGCPKTKNPRKPCITEITSKEVLEAFIQLTSKYEKS